MKVRQQHDNHDHSCTETSAQLSNSRQIAIFVAKCFLQRSFQVECAITDVDIKAKLALRGTAAPRKELRDWH
jgi:hypothetical protein